ncbi:GntR family transcriptional regulator [Brevifollis gellanilyticus]|uniref:GntR family transcriptional regulator n=2 Tax=Brevifollis gellanilyticus TaxID=748831 RepID=A0A512M944_9BACT|nr:GntR family transcriptional regulator [Brevifollis gellanilyticus]
MANGEHSLIAKVMNRISQKITSGSLNQGTKLPSIRSMARTIQVSVSTVTEAYERLAAQGIIRSRPGSGYYVAISTPLLSLAESSPKLDREVDPMWISRQSMEAGKDVLKPGCGWLPASWMPEAGIRRALRELSRADSASLVDYASPLGSLPLRQILARRLIEREITVSAEQIILTESGTQAIDLLCRFLVKAGDTVLVDDPCYFNFHALLRAHRVNVVAVPFTPTGPDLELFAKAISDHSPRMYITNSAIHNPTGAVMSPNTAHRLLKLAEQAEMTIIEDDIFADFEREPVPRLAAYSALGRVTHISSFSKTLSASVRCGYIAVRQDWVEGLTDLKIATSFGGSRLSAELVLTLLTDGTYRKHMDGLRARLSRSMIEATAKLEELHIKPWVEPKAGMFLWCQLPHGIQAADVARVALADGIVLAPGNAFSLTQSAGSFMRFNVAQMSDERLFRSLAKALEVCS